MKINLLKISGIDAKKFLQGQLTCDMEKVSSEQCSLGAHCNPQGRIISLFNIFMYLDDYYMLMPANMIPIAISSLKKYSVFYKTTLESIETDEIVSPKNMLTIADLPVIYPQTSGIFLPHELNLQQLNAISFDKGCYTGQEIIARMHYRGKLKKHMYRAKTTSQAAPLPGSDVYYQSGQETKTGGIIVDSSLEISDNQTQDQYRILLVCDEINAKNEHLFLMKQDGQRAYLTFLD